jgi:hypothetical protein
VKRIAGGVFGFARLRAGEGCAGAGDVVLLDIPGWDRAALDAAIAQGRPREVKLAKEDSGCLSMGRLASTLSRVTDEVRK